MSSVIVMAVTLSGELGGIDFRGRLLNMDNESISVGLAEKGVSVLIPPLVIIVYM